LAVRSLFEGATIAELGVEVEKAERQGQKARPAIVPRGPRAGAMHSEALLAHLDSLSAAELQSLLQRMLRHQ
jgi:hypothetical protein